MARQPSKGRKRGVPEPIEFVDEELLPWDRQPKEGEKAWQCFQIYRDLPHRSPEQGGPQGRSQRLVSAEAYPGRGPSKRAVKEIGYWSIKWSWVERAAAYDRSLDRIRQDEFASEAKRDAVQALRLLRAMRAKAGQALVITPPGALSPGDIVRMADTSITAIRREAGLATEISGVADVDAFATWLKGDTPADAPDEWEQGDDREDPSSTDDAGTAAEPAGAEAEAS